MRILGVDHGGRRIGLAITDPLGIAAHPLDVLSVKTDAEAVEAIRRVVREREVERIVVGLPLNMDGSEGAQARAARRFAGMLREALGTPVEMQDERLTTAAAERALLEADLSRARRTRRRDAVAAQVLLQTYLLRRGRPQESEPPEDDAEGQ